MRDLLIHITFDEDQISVEEIKDHIREFITGTPAYVKARFHEEN